MSETFTLGHLRPTELLVCYCSLLAVCTGAISAASAARICESSGYCSLSLQPSLYVGPIETNRELKQALLALAFKNEIIITIDDRPDYAAQFIATFHKAGYGHVLHISTEKICRRLARTFPKVGCGWYQTDKTNAPADEYLGKFGFGFEYLKYWTGVRAARMGYNTLILDGDVFVFRDFYSFVKSPPFDQYTALVYSEGNVVGGSVNCAFAYLQNASPNGPAVWALADAIIRSVRLSVQPEGIRALGKSDGYICWDQHSIHDALVSTMAGRPMFGMCVQYEASPRLRTAVRNYLVRAVNGSSAFQDNARPPFIVVESSPAVLNLTGSPSWHLYHAEIQLPHIYGAKATSLGVSGWPEELGGQIYGSQPMKESITAFIHKYLVQDVDTSLWPDLEDPGTVDAAAAIPTEMLAFTPMWLVNNFAYSGAFGHWHTGITNDSQSVLGHIHAGLPPGKLQNRSVALCGGHYNYSVSERLWGGPQRGFTASHHDVDPLAAVLAYAPGMFDHTTSHDAFGFAVTDLGKLGVAGKFLIGWPGAPLSAGWTHQSGSNSEGYGISVKPHVVPWRYINDQLVMAYTPWNETLAELQGVWAPYFTHGCVTRHAHILNLDERSGDEVRRRLLGLRSRDPSASDALGAQQVALLDDPLTYRLSLGSSDSDVTAASHADKASGSERPRRRLQEGGRRRRFNGRGLTGVGLLPPELKHFVSTLPTDAATRGPHNSLKIPDGSVAGPDGVTEVTAEHVAQESLRMAAQPIVWLTRLVRVAGTLGAEEEALFQRLRTSCCAMQYNLSKTNSLPVHPYSGYRDCAMQF